MTPRRESLPPVLWVALGSALGACLRWSLALAMEGAGGLAWATPLANAIGSAAIGLYAALAVPGGRSVAAPAKQQFVMAGVCGGFTTFSLFAGEWLLAMLRGDIAAAAWTAGVSVASWLAAVWAGYAVGLRIDRRLPRVAGEECG